MLTFLKKIVRMNKDMIKKVVFLFSFFTVIPAGKILARLQSPIKHSSIPELLEGIVNFLYWISFPIATLVIIISGFLFVTGFGNEKQITKAKNALLYTGIGFLVIILAKGVVTLVTEEFQM